MRQSPENNTIISHLISPGEKHSSMPLPFPAPVKGILMANRTGLAAPPRGWKRSRAPTPVIGSLPNQLQFLIHCSLCGKGSAVRVIPQYSADICSGIREFGDQKFGEDLFFNV